MPKLKISHLKSTLEQSSKALQDPSLDTTLFDGTIEENIPLPFENATFTVAGSATIDLFNQHQDADIDDIIGSNRDENKDPLSLGPPIPFSADSAWLKYATSATLKGPDAISAAGGRFNLNVEGGLTLCSYVKHAPADPLGRALLDDLQHARFIVNRADVEALENNEALTLKTRGKLAADVTVSWGDILAGKLSSFSALIGENEVFAVSLEAGIKTTLKVEIEDDYLLVLSRTDQGQLRVGVKKGVSKGRTVTTGPGIVAKFNDPDSIKQVLGAVLYGLFGQTPADVDDLLATANYNALSKWQKKIAERLAERLGLEEVWDNYTRLQSKINEVKKRAETLIGKVAEVRAEVSLFYEYQRVKSSQMLLEVLMSDAQYAPFHPHLLKGNLSPLLNALRDPASDMTLVRFLNQKTLEINKAFGFSLGLGNWSIKGSSKQSLKWIERTNFKGYKQMTFLGARGYEANWGGDSWQWHTDFNADMKHFSLNAEAKANEFDYTFAIVQSCSEKSVSGDELRKIIDLAVMWQAISAGEADVQFERLREKLAGIDNVTFHQSILFDEFAFTAILPTLAQSNNRLFADALGKAMPWSDRYRGLMDNPYNRRNLYGSLWENYLDGSIAGVRQLGETAARAFKPVNRALSDDEKQWRKNVPKTIAGLASRHPDLRQDWQHFVRGMACLSQAKNEGASCQEICRAFADFDDMGKHALYIRALGVYFLSLYHNLPQPATGVECILTISYCLKGKDMVENITM